MNQKKNEQANNYSIYADKLEESVDQINLRQSVRTNRHGVAGIRDKLVFFKLAWSVGEQYAGLPRALVFWLSLTPLAIANFNEVLKLLGIGFFIPLDYGSILAISAVAVLMIFGVYSYTRLGLQRREGEVACKLNPAQFLLYIELQDIKKELNDLKNKDAKKND